jgi:hypothetical protein
MGLRLGRHAADASTAWRVTMLRIIPLLLVCSLFTLAVGQDPLVVPMPPDTKSGVSVPTFPNSTCPIMGKKISMALFTDTELGRIYICCKGCDKKILENVPAAYKTAFPTTKVVANKACPISGKPIEDDAPAVTLQGHSFKICCKECLNESQQNAQIVLAKVTLGSLVDIGNTECPVTGLPVAKNAFVIVGDQMIRLSSPQCVGKVAENPKGMLAKAKALAK